MFCELWGTFFLSGKESGKSIGPHISVAISTYMHVFSVLQTHFEKLKNGKMQETGWYKRGQHQLDGNLDLLGHTLGMLLEPK